MTKRDVVRLALAGKEVPYVPWDFGFTWEARRKLVDHFRTEDLDRVLQNHLVGLDGRGPLWKDVGDCCVRDYFGVTWDRSIDKDIGVVRNKLMPEPRIGGYTLPDPTNPLIFQEIPKRIGAMPDRYRVFSIGFSLYERAWTLRGMEDLLTDLLMHPEFVHELLTAIADHNIAQTKEALRYDIDAVYFGDDWGQQRGLQMGYENWREFIYPQLKRMYGVVRDAGKAVIIHSCGDVDELFDDLVGIGLTCFNPFQPEVMDVESLMRSYKGRLSFHGGLSTQKTLPYGSVADVKNECRKLLSLGASGNYIFAPAHAVEGDVPLENLLAMIEVVTGQQQAYGQ
jgi:uroporphyrinogen decarboxylase